MVSQKSVSHDTRAMRSKWSFSSQTHGSSDSVHLSQTRPAQLPGNSLSTCRRQQGLRSAGSSGYKATGERLAFGM